MANKDAFKPKPLVDAALNTEFGGVEDLDQFKTDGAAQRDYLRVPGFSDMRYKRDTDLSEYYRGEIKGKDVSTLDWNARWFKTVKGAGNDPDTSRLVHAKGQGYRVVMWDEIGKVPWLTEAPPNAIKAPDGSIRISGGDLTLCVADKDAAARNAMRKKIRAEESVDGMQFKDGGLGAVGDKVKGAEPYVQRSIGTPAKGDTQ